MQRLALVLPLAFVFGCAHTEEAKKPTAAAPTASKISSAPTETSTGEKTCSSDLECGDKQLCIRQHCVDITPGLAECGMVRVHFPFNSTEIDPSDKPSLERSARCLKADLALHVTVEGNADERGTEEYNLALGDKRAQAVAKYLEALGASGQQLRTVSYGKENPLCTEHDEECWSKNRRAAINPSQTASSKKHK